MSIQTLREHGMPGLTMRYEYGGKIQVFKMGDKEVRLPPDATDEDIRNSFRETDKEAE